METQVTHSLLSLYRQAVFFSKQRICSEFSFAIITAHNPLGQVLTAGENRLLDFNLQAEIESLDVPYRSLYGCSPDTSHAEKSWMIYCEKATAIALASKVNQLAIYWVENDKLHLVPCLLGEATEQLIGDFSSRLQTDDYFSFMSLRNRSSESW